MSAPTGDIDIREGLSEIAAAITAVHHGAVFEMWNSDEDDEEDPAPRIVLISRERLDQLLEYEFRYESVSK